MKKLIVFFGILDVIGLVYLFDRLVVLFRSDFIFTWMNLIWLVVYFSLIISAFFLLRSSETGLWIYYIQFPFRVLWMSGASFGYLLMIGRLYPENDTFNKGLMIICSLLEIGRLLLTIGIHRRYYQYRKLVKTI